MSSYSGATDCSNERKAARDSALARGAEVEEDVADAKESEVYISRQHNVLDHPTCKRKAAAAPLNNEAIHNATNGKDNSHMSPSTTHMMP